MRLVILFLALAFDTILSSIGIVIGSGFMKNDSTHGLLKSSATTSMLVSSAWDSTQKSVVVVTTNSGETWVGKVTRLAKSMSSSEDGPQVDNENADTTAASDASGDSRISATATSPRSQQSTPRSIVLHVIFLVHGHRGYSTDLAYLKAQIASLASKRLKDSQKTLLLIHSVTCNEKKTDDGIRKGGERVAQEMREYIEQQIHTLQEEENVQVREVTLSLVGNSLGGLYSRYAVSRLKDLLEQTTVDNYSLPDSNSDKHHTTAAEPSMFIHGTQTQLFFNVFCTTASPHLGVADHTFFPLPRLAEVGIAHAMGETGRDLFRVNDLVKNMATSPYFLQPLSLFRKRIAYANAYSTDFVVPTGTAAFIHPRSDSLHRFGDENDDSHSRIYRDNKMIIASLYTEKQQRSSSLYSTAEVDDELVEMSKCLDSLGWKKVFVDMRDEIPIGMPLPSFQMPNIVAMKPPFLRSLTLSSSSSEISWSEESVITSQSDSKFAQSKELTQMFCASKYKISLPMGHNMIVAHTKPNSTFGNALNQRGQPVMDSLAQELVHELLNWNSADYV